MDTQQSIASTGALPGAEMTKTDFKVGYSDFRRAMRGDWAHTRPQDYPELFKVIHAGRYLPDRWMEMGTRARWKTAGRVGLF